MCAIEEKTEFRDEIAAANKIFASSVFVSKLFIESFIIFTIFILPTNPMGLVGFMFGILSTNK